MLKTRNDERIVLVWFDWASQGDFICQRAKSRIAQIKDKLENNEKIYFLVVSAELSQDEYFDDGAMLKIAPVHEETKVSEKWKGDDASWSKAFNNFVDRFNT